MKIPAQKVRAYVYRVLLAAGAVAVFYGLLSGEELALWLGAAATVLMVLPTANTPTAAQPPDPRPQHRAE